jgi:hypothetical protein
VRQIGSGQRPIRSYIEGVIVRVIAVLLAVLMMTGAATQVWAAPDVASAIDDDAPALDPAVVPEPVAVPMLDRQEPIGVCAPRRAPTGRLHAVFVFRPPRLVASR